MQMIPCGGFGIGNGLNVEKDEFGRPVLNASGSGLDLFVVNILDSDEAESGYVADKTYQEFDDAYNDDKAIIFNYYGILILGQMIHKTIDGTNYTGMANSYCNMRYQGDDIIGVELEKWGYAISTNNKVIEIDEKVNVQMAT